MLCTDIVMIQASSFIDSKLNYLFGAWGQTNLSQDDTISTANYKFNGATDLIQLHTEVTQYFCGDTFTLTYQAEQKMFGADVVVLEALGFLLSQAQDFPGSFCELVKPVSVVHLFVTPLSMAEGGTN